MCIRDSIGGIPFVVADGESGLLVEVGDEPGFASALDSILGDPDLHKRLREGAILKSAEFSWKATADRLLELYHGISGKDNEPQ